MASVSRLIHDLGESRGDATALITLSYEEPSRSYRRQRQVTYRQLYESALRLADALRGRGLVRGDRLAVLLDNSPEMIVSEWACLLAGYVWVALNARSSPSEHAQILLDSEPRLLVVSSRYARRIDHQQLPRGCGVVGDGAEWEALLASGRPVQPPFEPGPEDPVRLRYTSGTAGRPKGAVLPRRCYDASVETVSAVIGPIRQDDVLAQIAPMTHAAGAMWLPHAAAGARALLADRFDEHALVDLVARESVTAVFLVPTMLVRFLEAAIEPQRLRSLRTIVYGGASMPADRLRRGLELLGPVFIQIYGLTESNWPAIALTRSEHVVTGSEEQRMRRLSSCGRATPVGEVRIVDEGGNDVPDQIAGEILLRGRNTMSGYWRAAGADAKGLDAEGWMHTGDVAVRDRDGFITIVDRLHDMIVTGGFNVYPREVEDALSSHPAVLESAVVGRPDPVWGERVHAAVVLREGSIASEEELAAHVERCTAAYKKPRSFEFVRELPRNAAGKVLRRELKRAKPPHQGAGAS
ncbi:MAG TPA: AMP-binding protein [Candidatus Binatia bacterium]|nr:AMP-binding protein [Candidatus Binatia bacterium]